MWVAEAVAARGRCTLALAGGHTPRRLYEILGTEYRDSLPWSRVEFFWGDERCVPPDDERSNYHLARATLLEQIAVHDRAVHRIAGELGAEQAAAAYDAELARAFGRTEPPVRAEPSAATFDIVVLGIGRDGHTASLFPGHVHSDAARWSIPASAPAGVEPAERVTLTLRALRSARRVLFLVTGQDKREMLARVLAAREQLPPAPGAEQLRASPPAALVRGVQATGWFVDRAASA